MALTVKCPNPQCGKSYSVAEDRLGRHVKCAQCGESFTLKMSLDETAQPGSRAEPLPSRAVQSPARVADSLPPPSVLAVSPSVQAGPPSRIGSYLVRRRLGAGAMGEVWLAHDPNLERDVAIKVLPAAFADDEERLKRFLREARAAAQLDHLNTVRVYEAGVDGRQAYIVMQYVDGGSLDKVAAGGRPMEWREATRVIKDAATGLAAAHAKGLIHRDVKPANLMRTQSGVTKIADFGLARARTADSQLTQQGTLLGTPAYMAPELWLGQEADARSDLYALICSYYHLLAGRQPFDAPTFPALGYQHRYESAADPRHWAPAIPEAACRILARGLAKDPDQRYQSCEELLLDLDAVLSPLQDSGALAFPVEPSIGTPTPATPLPTPRAAGGVREIWTQLTAQLHEFAAVCGRARWVGWAAVGLAAIGGLLLLGVLMSMRGAKETARAEASKGGSSVGGGSRSGPAGPALAIAPFDAAQARQHQETWAGYLGTPVELVNSIGMKLMLIPAGEFLMGAPASERGARTEERPQHRVCITKSFYLAAYEVTQEEYQQVMGRNPSCYSKTEARHFNLDQVNTDRFPVESVSWDDATEFCRKLSQLSGERAAGRVYRLPTEAEWEYACRAGTTTPFHFGTQLDRDTNCDPRVPYEASYQFGMDMQRRPAIVGSYRPNAFGLCEMHGNVSEFCADLYDREYYASSPPTNPPGAEKGYWRVRRGGSWGEGPAACRAAARACSSPGFGQCQGFRVALELPAGAERRGQSPSPANSPTPSALKAPLLPPDKRSSTADSSAGAQSPPEPPQTVTFPVEANLSNAGAAASGAKAVPSPSPEAPKLVPQLANGSDTPALAKAPFAAAEAKQHQQRWAKFLGAAVEVTNAIGMELMFIPAGEFEMGTDDNEIERLMPLATGTKREDFADEQPRHLVRITQPFYLARHEVTVGQFRRFVDAENYRTQPERDGSGGSGYDRTTQTFHHRHPTYTWRNTGFEQTERHPVVNVTWSDAKAFCAWLSRVEKATYRLPTEAEWEYACRAGTKTLYGSGDDPSSLVRVGNVADQCIATIPGLVQGYGHTALASFDDGHPFAAPVGRFGENPFGLHDMHGNVWEWCEDWYEADCYQRRGPVSVDPHGDQGTLRVLRGGGCNHFAQHCRAAYRGRQPPDFRFCDLGFRVAATVEIGVGRRQPK
jgi:formylglycine-generating enzyme required for sulfatase activity